MSAPSPVASPTYEAIPLRPVAERSFTERLEHWADAQPEHDAVVCAATGTVLSYRQLLLRAREFAALLARVGAEVGDHVGIMLPNGLPWVESWLGCVVGGFVDVAIDHDARGASLRHYLESAEVTVLVTAGAGIPDGPLPPSVRAVVGWDDAPAGPRPAAGCGEPATVVHRDPRADMSVRFTSGTTGLAKPAVLTQSHLEVWAEHFRHLMTFGPGDRLYTPFPLSHHLASVMGVHSSLFTGGTCIIDARFSRSGFWARAAAHDATHAQVIEPAMALLMAGPPGPADTAHRVRRCYVGKPAPLFEQRFDTELVVAYALTEGSTLAYFETGDPGPLRPESHDVGGAVMGRPNPHFDLAVLDEYDEDCAPGVRGDISFRPRSGYLAIQRYHGADPAMVRATANQWFHTGDIGAFDAEGYLHFFGRSGDTIRCKGVNVATVQLEEVARTEPGVADAVVTAVPTPFGDNDLKLVVLEAAAGSVDPRRLLDRMRDNLPAVMVPAYVELRSELPRTRTLKIRKSELAREGDNGLTAATLRTDTWEPAVQPTDA